MIKNTELRLTNLVEYPGWNRDGSKAYFGIRDLFWEDGKVALSNGIIQLPCTKLEYLEPILLTEEWLIKFGFDSTESKNRFVYKCDNLQFFIYSNLTDEHFCFYFGEWFQVNVWYVHQLQNIVFALTGVELQLSST